MTKRSASATRELCGRLDRLAGPQYGVVSCAQLTSLGMKPGAAGWLATTGRARPLRRGAYRLCGAAPSWRGTALGAVLAAGEGAVLSHRSAAALWGLLDPGRDAGPLEITCARRIRRTGVRAHRHRMDADERTTRGSIPVTTVERTLLDLAESCDRVAIGRHIDEAVRRGLTTVDRLRRAVGRHGRRGRRRDRTFWAAMADRGAGFDPGANDWEQRMDRMWDRMGLPAAERQYRIRVAGGRSYRPDRAIVDARIAIDWNGFDAHGRRASFDADSERRNRLAAAGWFPLDFTSRSDPALIGRTVRAVYARRMAELYGPRPAPDEEAGPAPEREKAGPAPTAEAGPAPRIRRPGRRRGPGPGAGSR